MNRKQRQKRREERRRSQYKPVGENERVIIRGIFGTDYYKRVIRV